MTSEHKDKKFNNYEIKSDWINEYNKEVTIKSIDLIQFK